MSRVELLEPEFVDEIPSELAPGKLYISIEFTTAMHLCCCGCGNEVVTPLHPVRWSLTYDGESVTLSPSVGSWSLTCQSHYFVSKNRVRWAPRWSTDQIDAARAREALELAGFCSPASALEEMHSDESARAASVARRILRRLWRRFTRG